MEEKMSVLLSFIAGVIIARNWSRFFRWVAPSLQRYRAVGNVEAEAVVPWKTAAAMSRTSILNAVVPPRPAANTGSKLMRPPVKDVTKKVRRAKQPKQTSRPKSSKPRKG